MITLETGIPGSGKTLYCVDKLLRPLINSTIKHEVEGVTQEVPRKVYSNINGLLLDHEPIGPDHLNTWHEWVKPGDVIVYDEVQKVWPLAQTGSKVPKCIEALETHRHMGVDFILLTQHPMMIHVNITRLTGRHLHMRRLGNMGFATVYEWDGCSRTLLYRNTMSKFPYRFGRKAFDLYKSAEVHTKVARKLPAMIFVMAAAAAGILFMSPGLVDTLKSRISPDFSEKAHAAPPAQSSVASKIAQPGYTAVSHAPAPQTPVTPETPRHGAIDGCAASPVRCTCYDSQGKIVPTEEAVCRAGSTVAGMQPVALAQVLGEDKPVTPLSTAERDGAALKAMRAGSPIY